MSDTPRTDAARQDEHDPYMAVAAECAKMERELNAAHESLSFAREVHIQKQIALDKANHRIKRLEQWKESALEIERGWDANSIAKMLGGRLGECTRKIIQREVPLLLDHIKRLEEIGKKLRECASMIGTYHSNEIETIDQAEAAVEAWDKFNKETKQ